MEILPMVGFLFLAYLVGSIPFGFILIKIKSGQDIRKLHSGRTGGTNAMRAGGYLIGAITGILDGAKATIMVWIAIAVFKDNYWIHILSPIFVIVGHNYSVFLIYRDEEGKLDIGGGAGGGACVGGSVGFWFPSLGIILFTSTIVFYFIGYASVTTMSIAFVSIVVFTIRAAIGFPWQYALYGVLAEVLLLIALRPNIKALRAGTERLHGYRRRKKGIPKIE